MDDFYKIKELCDRNHDADSCTTVGFWYRHCDNNYKKAKHYYQKSCKLGDGEGCYYLGFMYKKGIGVETDDTKALKYFDKACKLSYQAGCEERTNKSNGDRLL